MTDFYTSRTREDASWSCGSRTEVEESKVLSKSYYGIPFDRSRNPNPENEKSTIIKTRIMILVKEDALKVFWSLLLLLAAEEASNVAACTLCALGDLAGTSLSTVAHGAGVAAVVALASSLGAVDAFFGDVVADGL
jgi:hypothetical protein